MRSAAAELRPAYLLQLVTCATTLVQLHAVCDQYLHQMSAATAALALNRLVTLASAAERLRVAQERAIPEPVLAVQEPQALQTVQVTGADSTELHNKPADGQRLSSDASTMNARNLGSRGRALPAWLSGARLVNSRQLISQVLVHIALRVGPAPSPGQARPFSHAFPDHRARIVGMVLSTLARVGHRLSREEQCALEAMVEACR
jgi:hypothetical protein